MGSLLAWGYHGAAIGPAGALRHAGRLRIGRTRALLGGLVTLATVVLATIAHHCSVMAVPRCVSPNPRLAWLGVQLALLHEDAGCGPNQMAMGASPGRQAGLVVIVVIPTLLINLWGLGSAIGFWVALRALGARLADAIRRRWPKVPVPPRLSVPVFVELPPSGECPLRAWHLDRSVPWRRGPPLPITF